MIMISYQLVEPFHFYPINILAALKWLLPKSRNKIYMDWTEMVMFLFLFFFFTVILRSHFIYFLTPDFLTDLNFPSKMLKSDILARELVQRQSLTTKKESAFTYCHPQNHN